MKHSKITLICVGLICAVSLLCISACSSDSETAQAPSFSLAWSEYPSWSVFGVAHEFGLINGEAGKMGPIEEKWNIDIVLIQADYDPCLQMYGAGQCDAVCITNMDILNPSLSRKSVAILPTSTSYGADACIVSADIDSIEALRGKKVFGLAKTVSEYCFARNLELLGEDEAAHEFINMDPGAAALAMQQKQRGYEAIVVWNPFVLETINKRDDVRVLFDSTAIPGEIIDMVVVAQSSLDKPGGDRFAAAIIDTFYQVNQRIAAEQTRDETLVALGEKFSHLDLESMKRVVEQTRFYSTPDTAKSLFTGGRSFPGSDVESKLTLDEIMQKVVSFCVSYDITPRAPVVGFGTKAEAPDANLRFDPSYIKKIAE